MKKLLIALGLVATLAACNSGGGDNNDNNNNTESVVHILAFNPYKLNAEVGKVYTAKVFLTNYQTMDNPMFDVQFSVEPKDSAAVLSNKCFIQAPDYSCNIEVEKLIDESGIVVTPILPSDYSYVDLGTLTIN